MKRRKGRYSNTETTPSRDLCLFLCAVIISYPGQRLERGFFLAFHHYLDSAFVEYGVPHFHCTEELPSELLNNKLEIRACGSLSGFVPGLL